MSLPAFVSKLSMPLHTLSNLVANFVNPSLPNLPMLVSNLSLTAAAICQIEEDPDSEETKDISWLLYDTALTASGFQVGNHDNQHMLEAFDRVDSECPPSYHYLFMHRASYIALNSSSKWGGFCRC